MSTRSPARALRRSLQSMRYFANGPSILGSVIRPTHSETVFRVRGGPTIFCPNRPGARVPVFEIFAEDAYRLDTLLAGIDDPVVLDIGAHIGCFSVAVAWARPTAQVHAYEASPATANWLRRNVTANGFEDRIVVHQMALADHEGVLEFADNEGGSSLNGLTAPTGAATVVPCTTLEAAIVAAGQPVDVVKIDTEGAEYAMVLASRPEAWAGVRRVVLEYHDVPGRSWHQLASFFTDAGFRTIATEPATDRQGTVWLERA